MKIISRVVNPIALFTSVMLLSMTSRATDALDLLQGNYVHFYKDLRGSIIYFGPDDDGKERLIILKLSPTTAYVQADIARVDTISGIADLQADGSLLYQEDRPDEGITETQPDGTIKQLVQPKEHFWCRFGIHPTKKGVVFSDPIDEQSLRDELNVKGACVRDRTGSSKGVINGVVFVKTDRHHISPAKLSAIKKSVEYQEAVKRRETFLKVQQNPETAAPVLTK